MNELLYSLFDLINILDFADLMAHLLEILEKVNKLEHFCYCVIQEPFGLSEKKRPVFCKLLKVIYTRRIVILLMQSLFQLLHQSGALISFLWLYKLCGSFGHFLKVLWRPGSSIRMVVVSTFLWLFSFTYVLMLSIDGSKWLVPAKVFTIVHGLCISSADFWHHFLPWRPAFLVVLFTNLVTVCRSLIIFILVVWGLSPLILQLPCSRQIRRRPRTLITLAPTFNRVPTSHSVSLPINRLGRLYFPRPPDHRLNLLASRWTNNLIIMLLRLLN